MNVLDIDLVQTGEIVGALRTSPEVLECEWEPDELGAPAVVEITVYGERVAKLDLTAQAVERYLWGGYSGDSPLRAHRRALSCRLNSTWTSRASMSFEAEVNAAHKNRTTIHLLPYHA